MPRQPPKLPSTVKGNKVTVRERVPLTKISITAKELTGKDGHVDPEAVAKVLGMLQDNLHLGTLVSRHDPTANKKIIQNQALTSGTAVQIHHGLGAYVGSWFSTRAYANSQPFAVVEAAYGSAQWPNSLDPTQYVVLIPSCTGTYDIAFCPA